MNTFRGTTEDHSFRLATVYGVWCFPPAVQISSEDDGHTLEANAVDASNQPALVLPEASSMKTMSVSGVAVAHGSVAAFVVGACVGMVGA